jgi:hypothetical protein
VGKIFEKLLLLNKIVSEDKLEHYKKMQAKNPQYHLGEILTQQGVIDSKMLDSLRKAEQQSEQYARTLRKQKKDRVVLEMVQKAKLMRTEEIAACIQEHSEKKHQKETVPLTELLVQKGYLTPYLVNKLYRKSKEDNIALSAQSQETQVINIPKYLRDKFLAKIAIKNQVVSSSQIEECWRILKREWPRKSLARIMAEKKVIGEKKLRMLLESLKKSLPEKYPYFHVYVRDTKLARLLVKKRFLSPWRINKCLLKQLDKIKKNDYVPLRYLIISEGYLAAYQFDIVLKKYGELVSAEIPNLFLVPSDEIRINYEIGSGISVLIEQSHDNADNDTKKKTDTPKWENLLADYENDKESLEALEAELPEPDFPETALTFPTDFAVRADSLAAEEDDIAMKWQELAEEVAAIPSWETEDEAELVAEEEISGEHLIAEPIEVEERALEEIDKSLKDMPTKAFPEIRKQLEDGEAEDQGKKHNE